MDDYISRQAAIAEMLQMLQECFSIDEEILDAVSTTLKEIPPADVRPVVLCRDCKHKGWIQEPCHGKSIDYCRILERPVELRFFCAAGERKELDG